MSATTSSALGTSSTTASASPSPTNSGGGGGPSSPLLFFVALGFGVVFTNLWIIVGVKYCFRYNQRNRPRMAGDDPDAVDLAAMPRQRRRREKKLMTMDEVNEKFPLTKYKTWRSTRAEEGLPTAGGINTASSRAPSIKNLPRVSEDEAKSNAQSSASDTITEKIGHSEPSSPTVARASEKDPKSTVSETVTLTQTHTNNEEDEEAGADQIQTAIPAEQLPDPGDTCAICIDVLEDDDDIRGLTCGHAFHASCVDPWLTSRRACCPLCKADYYTPKPRPEGETEELRRRNTREEFATTPMAVFGSRRGRGPPITAFSRHFFRGHPPRPTSQASINRRAREQSEATVGGGLTNSEPNRQQSSWRQRLNLPQLPAMSRIRTGTVSEPGTTPRQLEAGGGR